MFGEVPTEEMTVGILLHEEAHKEIAKVIPVKVYTRADSLGIRLVNLTIGAQRLLTESLTRELPVFMRHGEVFILGTVDEIALEEGECSVLERKFRASNKRPSRAQLFSDSFQVCLYRTCLVSMRDGKVGIESLLESFGLSGSGGGFSKQFLDNVEDEVRSRVAEQTLQSLGQIAFESVRLLPPVSSEVRLTYVNKDTRETVYEEKLQVNPKDIKSKLDWALRFWRGERKPIPVSERNRWKCNYCEFKQRCWEEMDWED